MTAWAIWHSTNVCHFQNKSIDRNGILSVAPLPRRCWFSRSGGLDLAPFSCRCLQDQHWCFLPYHHQDVAWGWLSEAVLFKLWLVLRKVQGSSISILLGEACGALYGIQLATALGFQRIIFFLRLTVSNSPLFSFTRTILTTTLTSLLETSLF